MATILFQGEPIERHLLRQRIAADRLEPLALPLGPDQAKVLIDVAAHDAWLPLSVGLLNCLRRLWDIVSSGPGIADRAAQEVHAYVILRSSLLAALRQRQSSARLRRVAQELIPPQLPTSSKLAHLSDDDSARYTDAFDQVESDLIVLGLAVGITSDSRTVQGIIKVFDDALDRIDHARVQRVLDRALITGLTSEQIRDYKRKSRSLWRHIHRQDDYWLAYALQITARIGEIWNVLADSHGGWHRYDHDEEAYQGYRHRLLRGLDQPESAPVRALVSDLLPHILPPDGDESGTRIRADMPNRLERLRSEIIALASEQGDPISIDLSTHGDLDEVFEEESWAWADLRSAVSRVDHDQHPVSDPPVPTTLHRNGRLRVKVTYEEAAALHWQMYEEFGDKWPTQVELAERLTHLGKPLRDRTFRTLIARWRTEGKEWPPPAEAAEIDAA
ncbi:MAG: hypothetical protein QM589_17320 [Thermomicrobiales bacterium]